jgi:hypothetical protein
MNNNLKSADRMSLGALSRKTPFTRLRSGPNSFFDFKIISKQLKYSIPELNQRLAEKDRIRNPVVLATIVPLPAATQSARTKQ